MMLLKTERLKIRRVAESDWRAFKWIWENKQQSRCAIYDKPNDTEDRAVKSRIARWASFSNSLEHMFFAVCFEETVIGYVALNKRSEGYEIGYCFHSDYHGNGYAKESISALLTLLSGEKVHKVVAGTALKNTASVRLLHALGFRQTGTEQVSFYQDADGADIVFEGGIFELDL